MNEKNIKAIKDNDLINEEFLNRNFFILINNMRLYIYEIILEYLTIKTNIKKWNSVKVPL